MNQQGIKSAELARKTGIGQPVIHRLMTGVTENPQVLTIKPIADYFSVTLDQLLGYCPLSQSQGLNKVATHDLNNQIIIIKTIASVFNELMPILLESYQKGVKAKLVNQEIAPEVLPLLLINCSNLMKTINQLQQLLINNKLLLE